MWNAQIIKSKEFIISQKSFMNGQTQSMYGIHHALLFLKEIKQISTIISTTI